MDFTFEKYKELLQELIAQNYSFQTFKEFITNPEDKVIVLRHDVEKKSEHALEFASIEDSLNIHGSYYFRLCKNGFDKKVISEISLAGHEIGYHYDDLAKCNGDYNKAIERFRLNIDELRTIAPIETICMDGSPLSSFDNKLLWEKYNYSNFDIIGEPYFDVDFNNVLYLTDTGRKWDGHKVNFRDKVGGISNNGFVFHSTNDIIASIRRNEFPLKVLMTFHPQRWTNIYFEWITELFSQRLKNIVKRAVIMINKDQ